MPPESPSRSTRRSIAWILLAPLFSLSCSLNAVLASPLTHEIVLVLGLNRSSEPASIADAIIRRHDQQDSLYLQLGSSYKTLVHLNLPVPSGAADGEGTLIAPRWVVTAAHVAVELKRGHRVEVGGAAYAIDSIISHPEWNDGPHDIALVRLESPVSDIRPALLYRDSAELNRTIVSVGYGDFGTGITGPTGNDRQVRGATNVVDEATEFWLKWIFDSPGSPRSTRLEGVSGPGDSGGPAYLCGVDREVLVGISSGQSSRATGGQPGRYGVTEYYTRVSRYVPWIESVTGPLGI